MKKVALVIGGSGMLSNLSKELAKEYDIVGVLGRSKSKMKSLLDVQKIMPIFGDYTNNNQLERTLDNFVDHHGKPELVVSWVHSTAPEATNIVASYCTKNFYEITGHAGSENDHLSRQHEKDIRKLGIAYHRVILGKHGDRWLNNGEISKGVGEAIGHATPEYLVGEL